MTTYTLMKHQQKSRAFLKPRKRVLDFSDAGTGKTPVHITDFADRRRVKRTKFGCLLVLAPKSLLKSAWADDFKKFAPDMKVSIAWAENREEAFAAEADVYITNYAAANWLAKKPKKFFNRFDQLVLDEGTAVKHRTSQCSKAVKKIAQYFDWRRLLTGTPTSNGICDLWHQVYVVDDGDRLGKAFFAFQKATCTPETEAGHIKWVDKPGIEPVVGALIEDITIRHRFEDCVDIPPNHRFAVPYTLTPSHRKLYQELENQKFLENKGRKISAVNGAVLYFKLLQCASGAVYVDPDDDESDYTLLDPDRYDLIMDLVEARQHSIVFFNWRHQKDELVRVATARGIKFEMIDGTVTKKGERERIVQAYQRGEYQVLLANAQTIGHGLTLTKGTRTIFASPTPNLEHFLQGYKRIYRITQTEKTETIMVIAPDTIDEYVWEQCQKKDVRQSDLLAYVES